MLYFLRFEIGVLWQSFFNESIFKKSVFVPQCFWEIVFRERDFNAIVFRRKQTYAAVNICTAIKPTHKYSRPPRY